MRFIEKRVNKRACFIRVSNIPNLALTACTLPFLNHQDSLELRCITRNSSKVKLALVQYLCREAPKLKKTSNQSLKRSISQMDANGAKSRLKLLMTSNGNLTRNSKLSSSTVKLKKLLTRKILNALYLFLMTTSLDSFLLAPKSLLSTLLLRKFAKLKFFAQRVVMVKFPALGRPFSLPIKLGASLSLERITSLIRVSSNLSTMKWRRTSISKLCNRKLRKVKLQKIVTKYLECKFLILTPRLLKFPRRTPVSLKL